MLICETSDFVMYCMTALGILGVVLLYFAYKLFKTTGTIHD